MELVDLGEYELIDRLVSKYVSHGELGPWEDAEAFRLGKVYILLKIDGSSIKSLPPEATLYDLGWRAAASTISDLLVKGGEPMYFLASVTAPRNLKVSELEDVIRGVRDAVEYYGGKYVGGDLKEGSDLSVIVAGVAIAEKLVKASSAQVGDYVVVTGDFGYTGVAIEALYQGLYSKLPKKFKEKLARPTPPKNLSKLLRMFGDCVTAASDSSDGLSATLHKIARLSRKGIKIWSLPTNEEVAKTAEELGIDLERAVFCGGEEFEAVLTVKRECLSQFLKAALNLGMKPHVIGEVVGEGGWCSVEFCGWQHFVER